MKALFFYCMAIFSQPIDQNMEFFLGVNIDQVSSELSPNTLLEEESMYWILNKSEEEFYGYPYDRIVFKTNTKDAIESINLILPGIIFDLQQNFEEGDYGKANKILTIDKIEDGEVIETDWAFIKESYIVLNEGDHDVLTTPFCIYWYKDNFSIRLLFDYDNNQTSILFFVNNEQTP